METPANESIAFDVVIVGAGPAGLAAAIHLQQLACQKNKALSICVVEKGASVGANILSGAILEPRALDELIPDWRGLSAPVDTLVTDDQVLWFSAKKSYTIPRWTHPKSLKNKGNYIISASRFCHWLGEYAEGLGIPIFPGFAATEVIYNTSADDCRVAGVMIGEKGRGVDGKPHKHYQAPLALRANYTLFAEGSHGYLGQQLIARFHLDHDKNPQHYALGIKELWKISPDLHQSGLVVHSAGWPLSESRSTGGGFLYHFDDDLVAVGLVTDLSYRNPHVNLFAEMQRYKTHPTIKNFLDKGRCIGYGARCLTKGGLQSQPLMNFPGGLLIGDDAGTLNAGKIKGIHTAMKSGILAAQSVMRAMTDERQSFDLSHYETLYAQSWAYHELYENRNVSPAQYHLGSCLGGVYALIDVDWFNGALPWTLKQSKPDYANLIPVNKAKWINYFKPDRRLTFTYDDALSLASIRHQADQPNHLQLKDQATAIDDNQHRYNEPAQRYCPADVYELVTDDEGKTTLNIHAQNCLHCQTCAIKCPAQNITWTPPEGGSGPNYSDM